MALRLIIIVLIASFELACSDYLIDVNRMDAGTDDINDSTSNGSDGGSLDGGDGGSDVFIDPNFIACRNQGRKIDLSPLDLLVLLDVSYSMDYDQKWSSVKSALKSFVNKPDFDGLGIGLQYFPLRMQCSVDNYQAPAVPIGVLPTVSKLVGDSLDFQQMSGGTPTTQALKGTAAYAKIWLGQHPDHKAVIVMASDGVPDSTCTAEVDGELPNSLTNVLSVATEAATTSPQVKTFVIGVGKDLIPLNEIAAAGGTNTAILVDTSANADTAFLDALTEVRRSALGCDFDVPTDYIVIRNKAQVRFVPDDGTATLVIGQVDNKSLCVQGAGWYFDDPNAPTKLHLCAASCDTVTQGKTGELFVEFACTPN